MAEVAREHQLDLLHVHYASPIHRRHPGPGDARGARPPPDHHPPRHDITLVARTVLLRDHLASASSARRRDRGLEFLKKMTWTSSRIRKPAIRDDSQLQSTSRPSPPPRLEAQREPAAPGEKVLLHTSTSARQGVLDVVRNHGPRQPGSAFVLIMVGKGRARPAEPRRRLGIRDASVPGARQREELREPPPLLGAGVLRPGRPGGMAGGAGDRLRRGRLPMDKHSETAPASGGDWRAGRPPPSRSSMTAEGACPGQAAAAGLSLFNARPVGRSTKGTSVDASMIRTTSSTRLTGRKLEV